jgi:hypothetical protein
MELTPWFVVMLVWLLEWNGPFWGFLSPMKDDGLMRLTRAFAFFAAAD